MELFVNPHDYEILSYLIIQHNYSQTVSACPTLAEDVYPYFMPHCLLFRTSVPLTNGLCIHVFKENELAFII